ncbi:MAG: amidase [Micrococcaceae bacterium]
MSDAPRAATYPSAVELRDDLAAGRRTAVEVTEHFLTVVDEKNPHLGAFMTVTQHLALERARQLDAEHAADPRRSGPMHGLPVGFKDLTAVQGVPTTFASRVFQDAPPATQDDPLPAALRLAGAVFMGTTTTPEFGLPPHSENRLSPPARNPLDPTRTAGGSSGGAAAAVASGMLPVAPGSDGGGSIRIPAAACGIVGLKPGRGTLPTDDQRDTVRNLGVNGPLGRTTADTALLFDAMSDPTATTGYYLDTARRAARQGIAPTSIGWTTASPFHPDLEITLSRGAVEALTRAVTLLSGDGHRVSELELDYRPGYHEDFRTVWTSGLAQAPLPEGAEEKMEPLAAHFLNLARGYTPQFLAEAEQRLTDWAADTRRQLAAASIVLTPVLAFAPPAIGAFTAREPDDDYVYQCQFTPYTSMVNVMGLPAISVPVLTDEDGMNWSVQAIGRPGTEAQLLALAARLETLLAG